MAGGRHPAKRGASKRPRSSSRKLFEEWRIKLPQGQFEENLIYKRQKGPTR
jgi:hypothetical protein